MYSQQGQTVCKNKAKHTKPESELQHCYLMNAAQKSSQGSALHDAQRIVEGLASMLMSSRGSLTRCDALVGHVVGGRCVQATY